MTFENLHLDVLQRLPMCLRREILFLLPPHLYTRSQSVLQCVAVCCSVSQFVAMCCSVLQCVTVCCSGASHSENVFPPPPHLHTQNSSVMQSVAVCCSALQRVAVCCSVLQCVAVCCSRFAASVKCVLHNSVLCCSGSCQKEI